MRILIVEDEPDMNRLVMQKLKKDGYAADSCFDGEEAWDYLISADYDAVILDIMMPKCDGLTLVKRMRAQNLNMPVLFLTARDSVENKVEGLDSGANDYLVKPFSFQELAARLRVLTRGNSRECNTGMYHLADLILDTAKHQVIRAGKRLELSSREFAVLSVCFVTRALS